MGKNLINKGWIGFGLQNKSIDNFFDFNIRASFIVKNQVANSHLPRLCRSTQLSNITTGIQWQL